MTTPDRPRHSSGPRIEELSTPDQISTFSSRIVRRFVPRNTDLHRPVSDYISLFLELLQSRYDRSLVGFAHRREAHYLPILDVYVVWPKPMKLLQDGREMIDVKHDHSRAFKIELPVCESFLSIVDPRDYPSIQELRSSLVTRSQKDFGFTHLLGCAQVLKPTI